MGFLAAGFSAPWFLAGALALGVPVFVHLLRRQTTTPRMFSSLMFFERGVQSSTRHRRLRYLLLFALRTALVALLVLAFANPFVRRANAGASGTLLLLVVDDSYSMRAADQGGSRLEQAKRRALQVLSTKPGGQRAQVMALGAQLQVLTQPVQDGGTLRAAVEGIQQGDSKGSFGELGRGLRALTETVHTPVELHLFSDMQKTEMPGNFADMVLPGNVKLVLHPVGGAGAAGANWTVESVVAPVQLADPKDKRRSRVEAVVAEYGAGAGDGATTEVASLLVDGRVVASKRVDVPVNGRVKVELEPLDVPYGFSKCEVRVSSLDGAADAFPADDASVFSVRRSDPERVLFVHGAGDSRSAVYFGAALGAAGASSFVLQPVSVEQSRDIDPTRYAFVVLSDVGALPSILENSLRQYVKGGGSVLVAAGTSAAHLADGKGKIPVAGMEVTGAQYYSRIGGAGYAKVGQVDGTHAVTGDAMDGGDGAGGIGGWSELKVFYAAKVEAGARVLVRLGDGTPLLMDEALGEGHVLVLASGFENLTNDLPLQPAFVPFVDRAARYLSGEDRLGGARVVDSFVQLRTAGAERSGAGVEVVDPEGRRPLSLAEAAKIQSYQLTKAGFYQLRFANGKNGLVGVNPDRRESDMTVIPEDVLKLWSGSGGQGGAAEGATDAEISRREAPMSLWWWVMLLALVAAVAESVVAAGYLGTQREEV